MDPSSSGSGHRPFTAKIGGSNPPGFTINFFMDRKKKKNPELIKTVIHYKCDKDEKKQTYEIKDYDFGVTSAECELCGSHSRVSVTFACPHCGEYHSFELYSD